MVVGKVCTGIRLLSFFAVFFSLFVLFVYLGRDGVLFVCLFVRRAVVVVVVFFPIFVRYDRSAPRFFEVFECRSSTSLQLETLVRDFFT